METVQMVHMVGWALAALGLVALAASFAAGSRAFARVSMPAALALFCGLVCALCVDETGLVVSTGSLILLIPLVAVELLAMNGVLLMGRDGGVRPASGIAIASAFVLVALFTAAPMLASESGNPIAGDVVTFVALMALWASFTLDFTAAISGVYRLVSREYRPKKEERFNFILVHGAGLFGTRPSPLLASRLDAAFLLWQRQGQHGRIVVSGGKGPDEELSEAEVMYGYLRDRGVPEKMLIREDQSTTTRENLMRSRELMDRVSSGNPYRVALVTSEFHVYRCVVDAVRLNMDVVGVAASSRGETWARSIVREFGAVTGENPWPYIVVAVLGIAGLVLL